VAFLIPENLSTRRDVPPAASRLAKALREALDDDATVWYEPLFGAGQERPNLVALVPDSGILVLEILGAKPGALRGTCDGAMLIADVAGVERAVPTPLARAEAFAADLVRRLAGTAGLGPRDRLPVFAGGVLAYVSRDEAGRAGYGSVLDLRRCLFRDDLEAGLTDASAFRRLVAALLGTELRDRIDEDAERVHRALIHPETVIGTPALPFPTASPTEELRVLDRRQEALARGLGDGHRVIRGVAGSGKTLVLTFRARHLAQLRPKDRLLVTCYNRALAGSLRRQLGDLKNVEIRTIDQVISRLVLQAGGNVDFNDHSALADRADVALAVLDRGSTAHYDHVLVDEAQDFPTSALQLCVRLLADGSSSLLVVADAAQNIYRNAFTWKAAGINASGRTRVLEVGYRNTREVLEFAHDFLIRGGDVRLDSGAEPSDESAVIPPTLSTRHGPVPVVLSSDSPEMECLTIAKFCAERIAKGSAPSSVAVLYGSRWARSFNWVDGLKRTLTSLGIAYSWATDPDRPAGKDTLGADPDRVVISTIHSAKGLEWRHVVLVAIFDDRPESDRTLNRRLIYVGMTRATEELAISASGKHRYLADLER
jgi:hypothetical protein